MLNNFICWRWLRASGSASDSSFALRHQLDVVSSRCVISTLRAILLGWSAKLRRDISFALRTFWLLVVVYLGTLASIRRVSAGVKTSWPVAMRSSRLWKLSTGAMLVLATRVARPGLHSPCCCQCKQRTWPSVLISSIHRSSGKRLLLHEVSMLFQPLVYQCELQK